MITPELNICTIYLVVGLMVQYKKKNDNSKKNKIALCFKKNINIAFLEFY